MLHWTIKLEIAVSDNWIQDGANPSQWLESIEEVMKANFLTYSHPHEFTVKAEVAQEPTRAQILQIIDRD